MESADADRLGEVGAAYKGCRTRICELVAGLNEMQAERVVPACPEWSVHDVIAHLSGVVGDALAGRLDGVATEPWTAVQVATRRTRPIAGILDEWATSAPAFEELLDAVDLGRQAIADVVTHEHDLRAALDAPGARDSDAVHIGFEFVVNAFVSVAASRGVAVQVRSTDGSAFGNRNAQVVLTGEPFELLRAMTGRRNVDQLRALQWQGDAETVLPSFTFGPFRPTGQRVDE